MCRAFLLILLTMLHLPAPAASKNTFFVGVGDAHQNQTLPVSGIKYQPLLDAVLTAFSLEEGFEVEYVTLSGDNFDSWFNESTIDFRFPDHPKWTAAKTSLFYSQPVIDICETTRFLPQNDWMRIADVSRLGVMKGYPVSREWAEQEMQGYTAIVRFDNPVALLKALISQEVDAIISDTEQLDDARELLKVPANQVVLSTFVQDKKSSLRVSSEQYPAMLEKLDNFLKTHRGLIAQIARRHGLDNGRACATRRVKPQSELAD